MKLDLQLTKRNKTILIISLIMVCLMALPFLDRSSIIDLMDQDSNYESVRTLLWVFWMALAATNVFSMLNSYDLSKLAAMITVAALILADMVYFFEHGRIDGGWFMDNLLSVGTLYLILSVVVGILAMKKPQNE